MVIKSKLRRLKVEVVSVAFPFYKVGHCPVWGDPFPHHPEAFSRHHAPFCREEICLFGNHLRKRELTWLSNSWSFFAQHRRFRKCLRTKKYDFYLITLVWKAKKVKKYSSGQNEFPTWKKSRKNRGVFCFVSFSLFRNLFVLQLSVATGFPKIFCSIEWTSLRFIFK